MNGDGNGGFSRGTVTGMMGALAGVFSLVGGIVYKSVDDRVEVRRQENSKLESKVIEHEGKIATALAERDVIQRELFEIKAQLREVQQEQARRTQYIPKSISR